MASSRCSSGTPKPAEATEVTIEPLHQKLCSLHKRDLTFYCKICKTLVCQICTVKNHKKSEGKHEPISISDACHELCSMANELTDKASTYCHYAKLEIKKCIANEVELGNNRSDIIEKINNNMEETANSVRETGNDLKRKLHEVCETKVKKNKSKVEQLKSTISDVEAKLNCITKLVRSDDVTDINNCHQAIEDLQEKIAVSPKNESRYNGKVYFTPTKDHNLGFISEKPDKNIFEIVSQNPLSVTCYQHFRVEITQKYECEIHINDLTVTKIQSYFGWKYSSTPRIVKSQGKYFVIGFSSREMMLNIMFRGSSIKGSPLKIIVKPATVVRRIRNVGQATGSLDAEIGIKDLMMSENMFLVACDACRAIKFKNSGAFVSTIKLASNTLKIHKIREMKNKNLIFSNLDDKNAYITFCKQDGEMIKSITIGAATESLPSGTDVNEDLNVVYVADENANCVQVYNMTSNHKVHTIGSKGDAEGQMNKPSDVAITKEGNIIVADTNNHRLQLFSPDGKFIEVIIGGGNEDDMVLNPTRVAVDNDDNIIVASVNKIQLFDNNGKFLRVIHHNQTNNNWTKVVNMVKRRNMVNKNYVFSIISHFPRRLALAEVNSTTIYLKNY